MFNTKELHNAFKILNKGVKDSSYFVFKTSGIYVTNVGSDISIVKLSSDDLKLDKILKIKDNINDIQKSLRFFKSNNTELDLTEDNLVTLINGSKVLKIKVDTIEGDMYSVDRYMLKDKNYYNFKVFKTSIDAVEKLRGKDTVRDFLSSIHFDKNKIVTMDGFKLGVVELTENIFGKFTLTKSASDYLVDILKIVNPENITIDHTTLDSVLFEFDNVILVANKTDSEYFNYNDVLRDESDDSTNINNVNIKELLDNIKFLESKSKLMLIDNSRVIGINMVKANDKDRYKIPVKSNLEFKLNYEIEGDDITTALNLKYTREVLNSMRKLSDTVNIGLLGEFGPVFFRNDNSTYLVLPVRLANKEELI